MFIMVQLITLILINGCNTTHKKENSAIENWEEKAWAMFEAKKLKEMLTFMDKLLKKSPANDKMLFVKAVALNELGDRTGHMSYFIKGKAICDQALMINPSNDDVMWTKAWALLGLGKSNKQYLVKACEEAIFWCNKALSINNKNEYAWYNKAWALYYLKKYNEALSCCERAIKINPNNPMHKRLRSIIIKKMKKQ